MNRLRVLSLPGNDDFSDRLAGLLDAPRLVLESRRFPDGESWLRLMGDIMDAHVVLVCTLCDPDPKYLSLIFAARTARRLGARQLTLVAPYLAYMRQDAEFKPGEALTSEVFANLVSREFDALVTVDPHLHRHHALSDIYSIPTRALQAAPLIGDWIREHVAAPLLIGPDAESRQWVEAVAASCGAPFFTLDKQRLGDFEVRVNLPDMAAWRGRTAVLVDDIVSSGRTLVSAAALLARQGFSNTVCVVVHPVFAGDSRARLMAVVRDVVSTDSIPDPSNRISLAPIIANALRS